MEGTFLQLSIQNVHTSIRERYWDIFSSYATSMIPLSALIDVDYSLMIV